MGWRIFQIFQKCLLALSILALIFLLVEIGVSLAATLHGSTPARVAQVTAGPYHFSVSLYNDPAHAGFTLPFAIAPLGSTKGSWRYQVTSIPVGSSLPKGQILIDGKYVAIPIKDTVSPDPQTPGGVQGAAEITVQGSWKLQVQVDGPNGQQTFDIPIKATTLPAIPIWLGWLLGFIPVYGIVVFLIMQIGRQAQSSRSIVQIG
jgi:hypothetical protein